MHRLFVCFFGDFFLRILPWVDRVFTISKRRKLSSATWWEILQVGGSNVDWWTCGAVFFSNGFVFSGDFSYEIARDAVFLFEGGTGAPSVPSKLSDVFGQNQMSNEKTLGCLGYINTYIYGIILPIYIRIMISHYKDPYQPTSIMESKSFLFSRLKYPPWRWESSTT